MRGEDDVIRSHKETARRRKNGELTDALCANCGNPAKEEHHRDYRLPSVTVHTCGPTCHSAVSKSNIC